MTASSSWAAFTVTVWAVSQLELVKVSLSLVGPVSVRSVPEWPLRVTVMVSTGTCDSFTVYDWPVVSPSTGSREVLDSTSEAVSSSSTVTARSFTTPW